MLRGYVSFAVFSLLSIAILASALAPGESARQSLSKSLAGAYSNERLFYSLSSFSRASADSAGDVSHMEKEIAAIVAASDGEETPQSAARKLVLLKWGSLLAEWNSNPSSSTIASIGCGASAESSDFSSCGDYLILAPPQSLEHPAGEIQTFYFGAPLYGKIWLSVTDRQNGVRATAALPDGMALGLRR